MCAMWAMLSLLALRRTAGELSDTVAYVGDDGSRVRAFCEVFSAAPQERCVAGSHCGLPQSGVLAVATKTITPDDYGVCVSRGLEPALRSVTGPRCFVVCFDVVLGHSSRRPHEIIGADASLYDAVVSADDAHWYLAASAQARPCAVVEFLAV
jgi:hypothetical protein